jgi:Domain of unknown function (DUF5666)
MHFSGIISTLTILMLSGAAAACGSDLTTPREGESGNPTSGSTTGGLDSTLSAGGARRVEIKLFPGELVAREFHLDADDNEEQLASRVTAIDPAQGTMTLELGGLIVTYDSRTRFRTDRESHESRSTWEAAVQGELAAGRRPLIEARRNPGGAAQSPDDASFTARDLRLETGSGDQKIEIDVDDDNLRSASGSSSVVLLVLGLTIEVNGRTRLTDDHGGNDDRGDDDRDDDDDDD